MMQRNNVPASDLSPVIAMAAGLIVSFAFIAYALAAPEVVTQWCTTHGCPVPPVLPYHFN